MQYEPTEPASTNRSRTSASLTFTRSRHWILLAGIALQLFFWILFIGAVIDSRGVFSALGIDFGYYWAAAHVFRSEGAVAVYDLTMMERYAQPLMGYYGESDDQLRIGPVVYPPMFLVLLQPLTFLQSPVAAFVIWTLINAAIIGVVGRGIARRLQVSAIAATSCLILFFPLTRALFVGQPEPIMLLGLWKGLMSLESGRPVAAGAWFGLLLLKPNYLPLLVILLLVSGHWRSIGGIALAGGVAATSTLAILGARGTVTYVEAATGLGLSVEQAVPSAAPDMMPTWRGVLTNLLSQDAASSNVPLYIVAVLVTLSAFGAILYLNSTSPKWTLPLAIFGTLLVTFLSNPHTHIHALGLLAAPGALLLMREKTANLVWRSYAVTLFLLPVVGIASLLVTGWITWIALSLFFIQLAKLVGVLYVFARHHRTNTSAGELEYSAPARLAGG
jgi:hypothetical protein